MIRQWLPIWLLAVGIVVGLALGTIGSWVGVALVLGWGFVLLPLVVIRLVRGTGDAVGPDEQVRYWRSTVR